MGRSTSPVSTKTSNPHLRRLTLPADLLALPTRRDGPGQVAALGPAGSVVLAPVAAADDAVAVDVVAAVRRAVEPGVGARLAAIGNEAQGRVGDAHRGAGAALIAAVLGEADVWGYLDVRLGSIICEMGTPATIGTGGRVAEGEEEKQTHVSRSIGNPGSSRRRHASSCMLRHGIYGLGVVKVRSPRDA